MNGTSSHHTIDTDPPPSEEVTLVSLDARMDKVEAWQTDATKKLAKLDATSSATMAAVTGLFNSPTVKLLERLLIAVVFGWAATKGIKLDVSP